MLSKKNGFPEEGDIVMCTVTGVHFHSVFVKLDLYDKTGLIHISEISPGRIRNIRDYVTEGKKIVCKILKIDQQKGHIDLSLRRVNDSQRRAKVNEIKREQMTEKMIEFAAKNIKYEPAKLYNDIFEKIKENYASLYNFFEDIAAGLASFKGLGISKEADEALTKLIKDRIIPRKVAISGELKIKSYASDGIHVIRDALTKAESVDKEHIEIRYAGTGRYKIEVDSDNYKDAEKNFDGAVKAATDHIEKNSGVIEVIRHH